MIKTNEALKKTERIASAAYLVTGFFEDKEPLKWDIRNLSSKIVSRAVHMKGISSEAQELLSLFSVAKAAGLVSDTNFEILSNEISKFVRYAEEVPRSLLAASFFDNTPVAEVPRIPAAQESSVPQPIKDKMPDPLPPRPVEERPKERVLKEFGAVAVKKNTRQSIIINLLKRKKEIMIKDVTPLIEGVSEKTIQRELLAMVDQGIIKKEGEKRWSRYSLAQ